MASFEPSDPWLGKTLAGRYRVVATIGAGGMGIVYRAWDRIDDRYVVVKRPRPELIIQNRIFLSRFHEELTALTKLRHPAIVPIIDIGAESSDSGRTASMPYAVMPYMAGGSLKQRLPQRNGKASPDTAINLRHWLPAIANALDCVHSEHFVHRDIKPDNIVFDGHNAAFLGDFGIVKTVLSASDKATQEELSTGCVIGTPHYMAPELVREATPDGRADQYALAVMVYEVLAGRKPFDGTTVVAILHAHANSVAPALASLRPDLPASLCDAVGRGMSKGPTHRFSSCDAFAQAVLQHVPPADAAKTLRLMCPSCGRLLTVKPAMAGRPCHCPQCNEALTISRDLQSLWLQQDRLSAEPKPPDRKKPWRLSVALALGILALLPLAILIALWIKSLSGPTVEHIAIAQKPTPQPVEHTANGGDPRPLPPSTVDDIRREEDTSSTEKIAAENSLRDMRGQLEKLKSAASDAHAAEKESREPQALPSLSAPLPPKRPAPKSFSLFPFQTTGTVFENSSGMKLVYIPAGAFTMGSDGDEWGHKNDETQVRVQITSPFLLGQSEVTQHQWQAVMKTSPWLGQPGTSHGANHAANYIPHCDATSFCEVLTRLEQRLQRLPINTAYSLPTEAQWEYVCRAGSPSAFSYGDDESQLVAFGWYRNNTALQNAGHPHEICRMPANAFGGHDMHGNVAEWCLDWYAPALAGGNNPTGPGVSGARIIRGGSWMSDPTQCRAAARSSMDPSQGGMGNGFRIAVPASPDVLRAILGSGTAQPPSP